MDKLMTMMFGGDFLDYDYDEKKICFVVDKHKPTFVYNREDWLSEYAQMVFSDDVYERGWLCFVLLLFQCKLILNTHSAVETC